MLSVEMTLEAFEKLDGLVQKWVKCLFLKGILIFNVFKNVIADRYLI